MSTKRVKIGQVRAIYRSKYIVLQKLEDYLGEENWSVMDLESGSYGEMYTWEIEMGFIVTELKPHQLNTFMRLRS